MNRTQVEVRFTDKLDSIRVDQREMEIPNAIKEKPIEEWFEATTGRVKWGGLVPRSRIWILAARKTQRTASCSMDQRTKSESL